MEENKYKAALERAKSAIKECGGNVGRIKMIESIFPELAGDMDEQSRKWILEYLYDGLRKADKQFEGQFKAAIAYLEKLEDIDKRLEVQYKRGYGKGYVDGMADAKKKELEKQGEFPTTISVDKMVEEFERARIEANSICQIIETDAYRKGVVDTLSKILIKEEKPITIGSKKAEGKLGEMIAASKEPAESGEEDKQLTHKEVTKKSDKVWSEEDEIGFGDTLWAINKARTISENENDMGNLWYAENWLKNIKGRLQ